ncbi:lipopolysaccharide biosynthesis protein [Tenacibaculum sp. MEBiC06402]|uniref:lipopolysaccharide biosynthesis protein n=1 Tax=unclassified Tenacibaculum TaxID=2635139 RepID=UPI003B9C252B
MGIIFKQSFKNTIVIYLGFLIGGLNTIFFYPGILGDTFQGIVTVLLSYSNLIMPLMALGVHYTIIKFFSVYQEKKEKDKFLSIALILPLLVGVPVGFLWNYIQDFIVTNFLSEENKQIESYTIVIYIVSICCAYFEVFYAWSKVHLKTVVGNFLKEFYNRAVVLILLLSVSFQIITKTQFIFWLTGFYILRTLIMMFYAFKVYFPKFSISLPKNYKQIASYSLFIIFAGSAGALILDIDKVMVTGKEAFSAAAYYTVAVFIGSFIEAPSRALGQILQPLTSKSLNENNDTEVDNLYKKSSINLLVIGGLFFLLINCNIVELFKLMPKGYDQGVLAVLLISIAKMYNMFLGNNGPIISNSKYYKVTFPIGIGTALTVYFLNVLFYRKMDMTTDGLALATLITVFIFNSIKLLFVHKKMNMNPITKETGIAFVVIVIMFIGFYFWDFNLPEMKIARLPIDSLLNMILKSIIIIAVYSYLIVKLKISTQINSLVERITK